MDKQKIILSLHSQPKEMISTNRVKIRELNLPADTARPRMKQSIFQIDTLKAL